MKINFFVCTNLMILSFSGMAVSWLRTIFPILFPDYFLQSYFTFDI